MQKCEQECQQMIKSSIPNVKSKDPVDKITLKHNLPPFTQYNVEMNSVDSIIEE